MDRFGKSPGKLTGAKPPSSIPVVRGPSAPKAKIFGKFQFSKGPVNTNKYGK
jgi:hypothetical protein